MDVDRFTAEDGSELKQLRWSKVCSEWREVRCRVAKGYVWREELMEVIVTRALEPPPTPDVDEVGTGGRHSFAL